MLSQSNVLSEYQIAYVVGVGLTVLCVSTDRTCTTVCTLKPALGRRTVSFDQSVWQGSLVRDDRADCL